VAVNNSIKVGPLVFLL